MATVILQVPDESLVSKVKQACKMLIGVTSVTVKKEPKEFLRPYTMAEIDAMLDEAEAAFEAGDYLTQDEVFHHREAMAV